MASRRVWGWHEVKGEVEGRFSYPALLCRRVRVVVVVRRCCREIRVDHFVLPAVRWTVPSDRDDAMSVDSDEWLRAVHDMTEWDRAVSDTEVRRSQGLCGDMEDALYEY
jgi:hypothetical protein